MMSLNLRGISETSTSDEQQPPPATIQCVALYDMTARKDTELSFKKGDTIVVLSQVLTITTNN